MSRTLAEMRSAPRQVRPERSITVCLAPDLVAEVQALTGALAELPLDAVTPEPAQDGPPRRQGQGEDPERKAAREKGVELQTRLAGLLEEMAEHEGELRVRANRTDGDWRNWCNEHPPRAEGDPGHDRDVRVASGFCNADDLLDDLGAYAQAWNDEDLATGDFAALFEPNMAGGDKVEVARAVVSMYESRLDFQQLRSSLSSNLKRLNDAASPAASGSRTNGSTGGSRGKSNGATTKKATESA